MTPERWQRVKDVFAQAIALEAGARQVYLEQACGNDADLRAEVASLLSAHVTPEAVLDRPASDYAPLSALDPATDRRVGHRIGAYELLSCLGRGGMGEVYRARRADAQYEKEVAIKLVRGGYDTAFVLERFRTERQILANLDHPNIARLLDGGVTADGQPYLVMELVEGQPIDEYCETRGLSLPARLRLFREVCAAVSYAHQRLVVHRDLKPGNILVGAGGSIKLLDFGIAKLLQPTPAGGAPQDATQTSLMALTPAFSSPEQILGLHITTASDVYSLGVVLFHLLTGRSPYRGALTSTRDAIQEVCETEPMRPSTAAAEVTRAGNARAPPDSDLDAITLRALRKEPERRYGSAEQLSEDLRRYLEGLPVKARGDRFSYRAGKFLRRHRVGAAATAVIALTLVAGIVAATREARVAEQQRQRAERDLARVRKLANALMFELHDAIADLPGSTVARKLLVTRALEYLGEAASESSDNDDLNTELAVAYRKVGDIQGGYSSQNAGDSQAALDSYRKSVGLLEQVAARRGANAEARAELGRSLRALALGEYKLGNLSVASLVARRALELATQAQAAEPQNVKRLRDLTKAESNYSVILDATGDSGAALDMGRKAIVTQEQVARALPGDRTEQRVLGVVYDRAALIVYHEFERTHKRPQNLPEAIELHRKALAIDLARAADAHDDLALRDVVADHANLGEGLMLVGDAHAALAEYQSAADLNARLLARDPQNVQTRINGTQISRGIGAAYLSLGQPASALRHANAALSVLRALSDEQRGIQSDNEEAALLLVLARAHALIAAAPRQSRTAALREWQEAERAFQDCAHDYERLRARGVVDSSYARDLSTASAGVSASRAAIGKLTATTAATEQRP